MQNILWISKLFYLDILDRAANGDVNAEITWKLLNSSLKEICNRIRLRILGGRILK